MQSSADIRVVESGMCRAGRRRGACSHDARASGEHVCGWQTCRASDSRRLTACHPGLARVGQYRSPRRTIPAVRAEVARPFWPSFFTGRKPVPRRLFSQAGSLCHEDSFHRLEACATRCPRLGSYNETQRGFILSLAPVAPSSHAARKKIGRRLVRRVLSGELSGIPKLQGINGLSSVTR